MAWIASAIFIVILLFSFVVLFGAPYLPTLTQQQKAALDLLDLVPGQTLLELGSGDGRMLRAAAERGIYSVGYELNPLLVVYSWLVTRKHSKLVTVKWANFWRKPLPHCEGIYVFLLDRYMGKLHKKITQEITSSVKLVSFAFRIPDKAPTTEINGMFLYDYEPKEKS